MKPPVTLIEGLRSNGQRATPQRLAVFEAMWDNHDHPTAEAVWATVADRMPTVSLRTVYSVLGELVAAGEIARVDVGGAARFDPNNVVHHHLVCDRCASVTDVQVDEVDGRPRPADSFRITGTEIVFRGVCAACDD